MAWKGSSNIDNGFVFDLRDLNMIDFSTSDQTVKLGSGSTWKDVNAALTPYNVSVVGGRINEVGVGGFLTGGRSFSDCHTPEAPVVNVSRLLI